MTIVELEHIDNLQDFGKGWDQLLSKSLDNHPFLTSEWLTAWWKHFGQNKELKLFTAGSEESVSLVIPVMYSAYQVFGSYYRKVGFVGSPESDYHSFVVTNLSNAVKNVHELIKNIMEDSDSDCVIFDEVPNDSATARLLEQINGTSFGATNSLTGSCAYISLPNTKESFLQNLGSNMRRNLKVWEKASFEGLQGRFCKIR